MAEMEFKPGDRLEVLKAGEWQKCVIMKVAGYVGRSGPGYYASYIPYRENCSQFWCNDSMLRREVVVGDEWCADWKVNGFNGAIKQAQAALRYLANNDRPSGGEQFPNSACCDMIADELEITRQRYVALSESAS